MISNFQTTVMQQQGKTSLTVILTQQLKELGLELGDTVCKYVEQTEDGKKIIEKVKK